MANFTLTRGANARAQSWEERDERESRRANWLPLEALAEDELFAATPQLRAVPSPSRAIPLPTKAQRQVTAQYPARPAQPRRQEKKQSAQATGTMVQARAVAIVAGLALAALALYVAVSMALEWTQVKLDDFQYGRPRTTQIDAFVGHNETEGVPSHFIAMNLNRRVTVMEMPGGDSTKVNTIIGPYLFGQGEDLTPVQVSAQDLNGDGKADLVVTVKSEQLIYLNDGSSFRLMTPEERAVLQKTQAPAAKNTPLPEVGK